MLLAKKDKDKQVLLAEDQAWMESSSDSDQEINANIVFMAQIEKVLSDFKASSSSADEKIFEEKYAKLKAERYEYMIRYSTYFDNDKQHRKQIADQQVLFDKMSVQMVELDKHVRDLKNTVLEKDFKIFELEECAEQGSRNRKMFRTFECVESSEKVCSESENQSEIDCLVVEKECDKKENPKVIAPGMFKLNVSQRRYVIWKKKGSSNTSNVGLSAVNV
nr:hypothetical protein [Tanacetum cinerariifolium]